MRFVDIYKKCRKLVFARQNAKMIEKVRNPGTDIGRRTGMQENHTFKGGRQNGINI